MISFSSFSESINIDMIIDSSSLIVRCQKNFNICTPDMWMASLAHTTSNWRESNVKCIALKNREENWLKKPKGDLKPFSCLSHTFTYTYIFSHRCITRMPRRQRIPSIS